jgi:hypothetical protein
LLGGSGSAGSTSQWQKLRKHSLQIGPSFTGNALIISRSANRSRSGHLPQMTQSSSEIDLQSGLANIADTPDESKKPRLRRCETASGAP